MTRIIGNLLYGPQATEVELHVGQYALGDMPCLQLMSEFEVEPGQTLLEPYMTITSNFPDQPRDSNELFIKDWSENEGILKHLVEWGIVEPPHRRFPSGFVSVPVCRMTPAFLLAVGDALVKSHAGH